MNIDDEQKKSMQNNVYSQMDMEGRRGVKVDEASAESFIQQKDEQTIADLGGEPR
jgi:hypothetical protein